MSTTSRFPRSYVNSGLERALQELHAAPSTERFHALLEAATKGGLVVDTTGSTAATRPKARTLVSSEGHTVLPLFTSMKALEQAAHALEAGMTINATILPAKEALTLGIADDVAAIQINPGPGGLVVARTHIEGVLAR